MSDRSTLGGGGKNIRISSFAFFEWEFVREPFGQWVHRAMFCTLPIWPAFGLFSCRQLLSPQDGLDERHFFVQEGSVATVGFFGAFSLVV